MLKAVLGDMLLKILAAEGVALVVLVAACWLLRIRRRRTYGGGR